MKAIIFIVGILCCCIDLFAQQSEDEFNEMIDSAICIKHQQVVGSVKDRSSTDSLNDLYLMDEQDQPLTYLNASRKLHLRAINIYDEKNLKIIKKGIYAWKVFTTLSKNQFTISIVDFYITYKNHNYNFANGGGSRTIFEYSCDEGKWKLLSSQNRGI